jgi:hypothetical protein
MRGSGFDFLCRVIGWLLIIGVGVVFLVFAGVTVGVIIFNAKKLG